MSELNDQQLLREFAETNSETAFSTLVVRHVNLVYSTAMRSCGNAHRAEEITQAVFVILAKKASSLGKNVILSGWLYQTTRLTAANEVKHEIRRQRREQEAYMQSTLNEPETVAAWEQIAPLLDDAMGKLGGTDRNAVVLSFFENKTAREVAAALKVSEAAAHKRISRALEKLRKIFSQRGVTLTAAAITGAVSANSVNAAPAAMVKTISAVAITKGAAGSATTLTLVKGALKIMAWTKAKTAAVAGVAAIFAISATTGTIVAIKKANANAVENYFAHWDQMNINTAQLPDVVILRPSKYANKGDWVIGSSELAGDGRLMRRGASFVEILQTAYSFGPEQMIKPPNLPRGQFDMLLTIPNNSRELLRREIKRQFGIVAHRETRDMDVLVLKSVNTNAPGIKVSAGGGPNIWTQADSLKLIGYKISDPSGYDISHLIGSFFGKPVIDETGLTDAYDVDVKWNGTLRGAAMQKEIERVMREQFGLTVTPDNRLIDVLVVEKAK